MKAPVYDLAIIGGGINGCGIARDAAGRGLSVFLCEQEDLANGTSSASTKLIHGGLRYLEYYEFRLVREALREREVLLNTAPHIIWPLRFILPHHDGLRPAWLIRLGLFLYDHIGGRKMLPATTSLNLQNDIAGSVLKADYSKAFEYSDCWVMDSRLVVLNGMDAKKKGAEIHTRTPLISAKRPGKTWKLNLFDKAADKEFEIEAKVLINATGPWLDNVLQTISHEATDEHIRMVKGSHIIIPKLFEHERAYIFQNQDGRIIFAIPYENDFTLIGTTDVDFNGNPDKVGISENEINYLCQAASEYFKKEIVEKDVISSFSGVRPLFDDGKSDAKAATRDYVLNLDTGNGNKPPLLSIYGGKITTYRKLAESVLTKLSPHLPYSGEPWTEKHHLPGGDFHPEQFGAEVEKLQQSCSPLHITLALRLFRTYGTKSYTMTKKITSKSEMGQHFGHNLYSFEVDYLIENEWAKSSEDILWRRSKLGLYFTTPETEELDSYVRQKIETATNRTI